MESERSWRRLHLKVQRTCITAGERCWRCGEPLPRLPQPPGPPASSALTALPSPPSPLL